MTVLRDSSACFNLSILAALNPVDSIAPENFLACFVEFDIYSGELENNRLLEVK
ncbi:hypothetical protein ACJIZ3_006521 [Penstemon smallii]|uniref:Uncharacterized protein n=1 Tax=Penstemon smallii TaxID=265156 RepID=A0ABD3S859_9LAMI